jgi:membrane-bound ClpP family serine protease
MDPIWYGIGFIIYLYVGLMILFVLSRRYPGLLPFGEFTGIDFLDIAAGLFLFVWLLIWPLHLIALPWTKRLFVIPRTQQRQRLVDKQGTAVTVGARGVSATDLRPVGRIEIDGQNYEARAQHGFIAAGQTVVVVGRLMKCLVVRMAEVDTQQPVPPGALSA